MKIRFENMASQEIYEIFFNALRNKEGVVRVLRIDGEKKPVFFLKKNPFDKKLVIALNDLSIHQVKTFLGQVVSVEKVLDINQSQNNQSDRLRDELKKISQKISEDMKSKLIERLKARKIEIKTKEFKPIRKIKPREFKPNIKPRRPLVRRSMAK